MRCTFAICLLCLIASGCSSSGSSGGADSDTTGGSPGTPLLEDNGNSSGEPITTIDASTVDDVLLRVIDALNTVGLDAPRQRAFVLANELQETGLGVIDGAASGMGLTLTAQNPLTDAAATPQVAQLLYSCENGGSLDQTLTYFVGGAPFQLLSFAMNDCSIDDRTYSGAYRATAGPRSDAVAEFTEYVDFDGQRRDSINGLWTNAYRAFSPAESLNWANASYEAEIDGEFLVSMTDITWQRTGQDTFLPSDDGRFFVTDLDGIEREIRLITYDADLRSSFNYADALTRDAGLSVSVQLGFSSDYFVWQATGGNDVPAYPVSDLGSPLATKPGANAVDAPVRLVDQAPRPEQAQWQTGQLTITASDGSSVTLRPNPNDRSQVFVDINNSNESATRAVDNGYQIDCPSVIDGC